MSEDDDDFWMNVSSETLRDLWEAPEEDYWDKLYAEQYEKPRDSQVNPADLLPEE